jgi:hypothetical protein
MSESAGMADALAPAAGRLRCPCCHGRWCRCRECSARYAFGDAVVCATPLHEAAAPLFCRCGALVDGPGTVRTPRGRQLALTCEPERLRRRLIARLRAHDDTQSPLRKLVRAAARAQRRKASTAA